MCSVIEIKNANEYYIRYHGPESMLQQQNETKNGTDQKSDSSGVSGDNTITTSHGNLVWALLTKVKNVLFYC